MRVTSLTIFAAFVIVSSSAPQLARAQVPSVPSSESQQSMYSRVKEKPYSAMQTETRVNTLDDGTKITKKTEALIWRDREGRVRIERILTSNTGPDIHHVIVYDLVGNAQLSWTSERKVAEISPLLRPGLPQTAAPSLAGPSKTMPSAQQEPAQTGPLRYHREELPPEEIDGLHIVGYRTTHVVPAGTAKNEHDVVVTDEFKYCTDLDIAFSIHMRINPLGANYSVELTNIDRSEPDPALFQPPVGYQTEEMRRMAHPSAVFLPQPQIRAPHPSRILRRVGFHEPRPASSGFQSQFMQIADPVQECIGLLAPVENSRVDPCFRRPVLYSVASTSGAAHAAQGR